MCTSEPEELKTNGKPVTFLGFQYTREADCIKIDPSEYTDKVLESFGCTNVRKLKTTGEPGNFILDPEDRKSKILPKDGKEHKKYRRLVGQLLWLSSVRRDIAFSVKELSKFVHDPTEDDMDRGYHVLRYLIGTKHECIYLRPRRENGLKIESFTDADLAGCRTSRKSTSGGSILLNESITHTWAKQQDTIADSSAESEFIGMTYACKQIKYLQQFLDELELILEDIPILHVDNTSAMTMVTSNIKSRVKHLDRKKYWIRDFVANKNVIIKYIETKKNLADIFTKYVDNSTLEVLRPAVMGKCYPEDIKVPEKVIKDDSN